MVKTVKLDLNTHPIEALKDKMGINGIRDINITVAETIVKAVKSAGLNGIAITEHNNFNHGWVTSLEILDHFEREHLIILPGEEIDYGNQQFLHIYIPEYYRRRLPFFQGKDWFWIMAHPGYYYPLDMDQFTQVHIDAVEARSIHGEFAPAEAIAVARNIPMTRSSDAHKLEDLGTEYIEVEFKPH
jgi:histidinol phosphatase-like PHP family hydrolase